MSDVMLRILMDGDYMPLANGRHKSRRNEERMVINQLQPSGMTMSVANVIPQIINGLRPSIFSPALNGHRCKTWGLSFHSCASFIHITGSFIGWLLAETPLFTSTNLDHRCFFLSFFLLTIPNRMRNVATNTIAARLCKTSDLMAIFFFKEPTRVTATLGW